MINQNKCISGMYSQILCTSQNCLVNPFICQQINTDCQCKKLHKNCIQKIHISSLYLILQKNRHQIPQQTTFKFDQIIYLLSSIIKQITQEYYKLAYYKQTLGLDQASLDFYQILKTQNYSKLTGNYIHSIMNRIPMISTQYNSIIILNQYDKVISVARDLTDFLKNNLIKYNKQLLSYGIVNQDNKILNKQILDSSNNLKKQYTNSSGDFKRNQTKLQGNHHNYHDQQQVYLDQILSNISQFKFSNIFKGQSITISPNGLSAIQNKTDSTLQNTLALMQPGLTTQLKIWNIKVVNQYICLGICLKNRVMKQNYGIKSFSKTGHGVYLIGNFGFVLSHSNDQINNKFLSFEFKKNDVITIKYDIGNRKLSFMNKKTQDLYQMDIQSPINDIYYGCVYLYQTNWCGEITSQ